MDEHFLLIPRIVFYTKDMGRIIKDPITKHKHQGHEGIIKNKRPVDSSYSIYTKDMDV